MLKPDEMKATLPEYVQNETRQEFNLETLKTILKEKGVQIEETKFEIEIPSVDDIDFAKLSGTGIEENLTKNLRGSFERILQFLTDYRYIIDNFGNNHSARQKIQSEVEDQVGKQYGVEAVDFVRDVFMRSKMRNNVLFSIGPEQLVRIIRRNPRYGEEATAKIQELLDRTKGENDPQRYEGEERLEKVRAMDQILKEVLIEVKRLSDMNVG